MKVVVTQTFRDKVTGDIRKVGEEFTCTKKRYAEITSVGDYVKEVAEETAE